MVYTELVHMSLLTVIKLLGFKDRETLLFEDNIKHSNFIYPDELVRSPPDSRGPHEMTWALVYVAIVIRRKQTNLQRAHQKHGVKG